MKCIMYNIVDGYTLRSLKNCNKSTNQLNCSSNNKENKLNLTLKEFFIPKNKHFCSPIIFVTLCNKFNNGVEITKKIFQNWLFRFKFKTKCRVQCNAFLFVNSFFMEFLSNLLEKILKILLAT